MTEQTRASQVIRASEIGEYVYCHRAWWLGRVQGVPNANREAMTQGVERHRAHGAAVRRTVFLRRIAVILFIVAAGLLVVLLLGVAGIL